MGTLGFMVLTGSSSAQAAEPTVVSTTATLSILAGTVKRVPAGSIRAQAAKNGMNLRIGDRGSGSYRGQSLGDIPGREHSDCAARFRCGSQESRCHRSMFYASHGRTVTTEFLDELLHVTSGEPGTRPSKMCRNVRTAPHAYSVGRGFQTDSQRILRCQINTRILNY